MFGIVEWSVYICYIMMQNMKKEETRKVITCRPKERNRRKVFDIIDKMSKKTNSPSVSHTVETILLDYAQNINRS